MTTIEELRRRMEVLESNHSGIGSEVAVVKAEVGTMQRDINFVRSSVDSLGVKLDTVLTSLASLQTHHAMHRPPRDPIDLMKAVSGIVLSIGTLVALAVGAVTYIVKASGSDEGYNQARIEQPYDTKRR